MSPEPAYRSSSSSLLEAPPLTAVLLTLLLAWFGASAAAGQWTTASDINTVVSTDTDHANQVQTVEGPHDGTYVLWTETWAGDRIFLQYINSVGNRRPVDGLVSSNGREPVMLADGVGGVIVVWVEGYSTLQAQRFNGLLNPVWTNTAILATSGFHSQPAITSDGGTGAIVSWTHRATQGGNKDIHAQRIDDAGNVLWNPSTGFAVTTHTGQQSISAVAPGAAGGDAFVVWEDARTGASNLDLWVRYIAPSSAQSWSYELPIANTTGPQRDIRIVSDGAGGAIAAWRDDSTSSLYAQRIDPAGIRLWSPWDGVQVGTQVVSTADEPGFSLGGTPNGEAVLAWAAASAPAGPEIRFQRLSAAGAKDWGTGTAGLALSSGATPIFYRVQPSLAVDDLGGVLVTWATDHKNSDHTGDIYSQYVDALTGPSWQSGGVVTGDAPRSQRRPSVSLTDGECPAQVAFSDARVDNDVYIQRIKCDGNLGRIGLSHDKHVAVRADVQWTTPTSVGGSGKVQIVLGELSDADLTPVDNLDHGVFELTFDPRILQVTEVLPGTFGDLRVEIDGHAGVARVEAPRGGMLSAERDLFTLVVKGIGEGESAVAFSGGSARSGDTAVQVRGGAAVVPVERR
ncbi:MAG: cohesin domain-containing protein [Acidobacteriota bacterium]